MLAIMRMCGFDIPTYVRPPAVRPLPVVRWPDAERQARHWNCETSPHNKGRCFRIIGVRHRTWRQGVIAECVLSSPSMGCLKGDTLNRHRQRRCQCANVMKATCK